MEVTSFKMEKDAIRELPHKVGVNCNLKDTKKRLVDFDGNFLRFHEGFYQMGTDGSHWKTKCLINKWSPVNRIHISGFSLLKNIRNQSIITLENYYEDSGQPRIVISWVDGSLTAWLKNGGYKKAFETGMTIQGSIPSKAFRRIIIDTCKGLEHLFSKGIYPSAIKESDLFLCKERVKGEGHLLKLLICQADNLSDVVDENTRKTKLWTDVKDIFHEISKHADEKLTAAAKHFIDYIATGNVEKLAGYPDAWSFEKKACYLCSLISAGKSKICPLLMNKSQFAWPPMKALIQDLLCYEQRPYDTNEPYDYLRLCRNVIKHWAKFSNNVRRLKLSCPTVDSFLQKLEEWSPGLWCNLYNVVGWP